MSFTQRPGKTSDLESSSSILRESFIYDASSQKSLVTFWKHLLEASSYVYAVVEDRRLPKGKRQVAFGLSVFVTHDFALELNKNFPPFLSLRFVEKWRKGEDFILNRDQIKAKAEEGLSCVGMAGWDRKRLSSEDALRARQLLMESFVTTHAGFPMKEYFIEAFGNELRDFIINGGGTVRRDYREFRDTLFLPKSVLTEDKPYLMGFSFAEAAQKPGTLVASLYSKNIAPRFHFLSGEKEILQKALAGETDEDIAESLHLSPWTIKKRWQTVYDKVMKADPDLLTEDISSRKKKLKSSALTNRLKQRRRFLLDYLRSHPEEFRLGRTKVK